MRGLIDGFVIDTRGRGSWPREIAVPVLVTNTLMRTLDDKVALAARVPGLLCRIAGRTQPSRGSRSAEATAA